MKTCTVCKKEKTLDMFSKKHDTADGYQHSCKECKAIYLKEHYLNNKDYYKNKAKISNKLNNKLQFIIDFLKEHPCVDCGEKDPIILQFDHMRDKQRNICNMSGMKLEKIKEEIAKCEIRCANCHIKKTAKQLGWYKNIKL